MTLGLAMIMKDELKDLERILENYGSLFDKIFITVTHMPTFKKLTPRQSDRLHISFFEWQENFGVAREFNRRLVDTDYWFWMDMDDTIVNPEQIRSLFQFAAGNNIDATYLKYDYYQNAHGDPTNDHWRERIIRTKSDIQWSQVPIHETASSPNMSAIKVDTCHIKHSMTPDELLAANARNKAYLLKDWQTHKDPRTAYYLGLTYGAEEKWNDAVRMFKYMIRHGWPEQQADAYTRISDCYYRNEDYRRAIDATNNALDLQPENPTPYFQKVLIYMAMKEYAKALEWAKVAMNKPEPTTLQQSDPTLTKYKGLLITAQAYLCNNFINEAYALYQRVQEIAPYFIAEYSQATGVDWARTFQNAFDAQLAGQQTRWLMELAQNNKGNPAKLVSALPDYWRSSFEKI